MTPADGRHASCCSCPLLLLGGLEAGSLPHSTSCTCPQPNELLARSGSSTLTTTTAPPAAARRPSTAAPEDEEEPAANHASSSITSATIGVIRHEPTTGDYVHVEKYCWNLEISGGRLASASQCHLANHLASERPSSP